MARPRRTFPIRQVRPSRAAAQRIPTFVSAALGTVDWPQWFASEDYRVYTNLQVFGGGLALYAGKPPTLQALVAGMQAVFDFARINAPWPPPGGPSGGSKVDMAAAAAIEAARVMYDEGSIRTALGALQPRWEGKGDALPSVRAMRGTR